MRIEEVRRVVELRIWARVAAKEDGMDHLETSEIVETTSMYTPRVSYSWNLPTSLVHLSLIHI